MNKAIKTNPECQRAQRKQPPQISEEEDQNGFSPETCEAIRSTLGTTNNETALITLGRLRRLLQCSDKHRRLTENMLITLFSGIAPRDELETMLASQMIASHELALTFMGNAMAREQTRDGAESFINRAVKLMRTFTAQIEALNRYRGKGQQKVIVKHVYVNEGGQAIVGNVAGGGCKHGKHE